MTGLEVRNIYLPTTAVAKKFIDQHLCERIGSRTVASAVAVSIRSLQAAFRSDLGTTPTAFIRSERLDRVRSDLQVTPACVTVTDIATRWGITHLGRFAADYRARFGESPSQTRRHG